MPARQNKTKTKSSGTSAQEKLEKGIKVLHAGPLGPQVPQVTGFDDLCQGGFGPEQYI